jgi:putative membrane protein
MWALRFFDTSVILIYLLNMTNLVNIFVGLIALLHVWFLVLEMFLWTKPIGLKVFKQTLEKAKASEMLAANQGLYNGFLAAGLLWGVLEASPEVAYQFKIFFLSCIMVAGIFGAFSVNRRILYIQAIPAMFGIALVALLS